MSPLTEGLIFASIAVAVTVVSHKIIKLYYTRSQLPAGPFPWPVVGNLLSFRKNLFAHEVIEEMASKYGQVFTMYLGHMASVVVNDPETGLQVLKKHTFAGRPQMDSLMELFFREGSTDIALADFGKEWEALRKVGHSAARKYAVSPQLSPTVTNAVDRVIEAVKEQPFDSGKYLSLMMMTILAQAAFGKKYAFDDPEFLRWKQSIEMQQQNKTMLLIFAFLPFLRHVLRGKWKAFRAEIDYQRDYIEAMYKQALENYTDGKNETFCDATITAKKEAEMEESWMQPYFKPQNLYNVVSVLFAAGTDTTQSTLGWIFIMMAKFPEMQETMRREVDTIGDNDPQVDDRSKLNFVRAFISETMRYRPISGGGVAHKTTVDEELDGKKIPKGTTVVVPLLNALHDENVWGDPKVFRPNRFLDSNGKYVSKPNPYFIPFSDGRRSCPGNKLALNSMFLVVTRFLQKTSNITIPGGVNEDHLRGDLAKAKGWMPIQYSLQLTLKS